MAEAASHHGHYLSQVANFDQKHGIEIIIQALQAPCKTIASNAGVEGAVIVGKLLESTDTNWGYDAQVMM